MAHLPAPKPASLRQAVLAEALTALSTELHRLRAVGSLTPDLLVSMRSPLSKYVPDYVFRFVRDAETCTSYDETIRDRTYLVDRTARAAGNSAQHGDQPAALRSELALAGVPEDVLLAESRCAHMRRMLALGLGILEEAWSQGVAREDHALRARAVAASEQTVPHPRFGTEAEALAYVSGVLGTARAVLSRAEAA